MTQREKAQITVNPPGRWANRHRNVIHDYDHLYDVWNPAAPSLDIAGDMRVTIKAIQYLIADAAKDRTTLRAVGAGWSLSHAATAVRMLNTAPLNKAFMLKQADLAPGSGHDVNRLTYLQCGVSIDEARKFLASQSPPLDLKTSGASNGQTIVGAISTGTHGSAFRFGSTPDFVTALHIITAPDRTIWLERSSAPVASDALVGKFGASLVRDDHLFNAALVSFGSFGVIHGVVIAGEPLSLLEATRKRLPLNADLRRAIRTLDFTGLALPHPDEEPFHFEVVLNPHDRDRFPYVTTMYKRPYDPTHQPVPETLSKFEPGDDVVALLGNIGDVVTPIVAPIVNMLVKTQYGEYAARVRTPAEIFSPNLTYQKEMSAEIGIPLDETERAVDVMLGLREVKGYPGVIALRFVKGSQATLAFTKFPTTCTIELPAGYARRTVVYYEAVWQALEKAGIPYTLHWGQMNNFTPARVRTMYGNAVDEWIRARNQLLSPEMREVFSSPFLQKCGLA